MVWISFLVALVLLVAAIVLLRLDAKQRGGGVRRRDARHDGAAQGRRSGAVGAPPVGELPSDDDEDPLSAAPADEAEQGAGAASGGSEPRLAPFQLPADPHIDTPAAAGIEEPKESDEPEPDAATDPAPAADADADGDADLRAVADHPEPAPLDQDEPAPLDPTEPTGSTVESSPRLLDRVRALLPARRRRGAAPEPVEETPVDPLAGSPVVRWLEDREFAPTPTPAPEFMHGDFAGGLSALGTVSHGVFRGRRAIMGVTGGRTVIALRRDTASDVVLDLSRPDIDAEPGFHDAGEIGALEARTSDYGRLDLIDRGRLVDAVGDVPAGVRRIWAEGEWVAATIDGVDDPSSWDDVVVALHGAADVLAPFPPIGGRARALPVEIDPGAPGAAAGPEADPTVGMDGEVGTGTHGDPSTAGLPDPEDFAVVDDEGAAPTADNVIVGATDELSDEPSGEDTTPSALEPRRAGHLRLVPERKGVRDLTDAPVVADRGDVSGTAAEPTAEDTDATEDVGEPIVEEPDPFAQIMEPSGPVPARGDVAADHLAPRPPLSRPTRGIGQAYPEDASVPPLAAGATTGGAGIKPLGSEDDEDEIRDEVARFDAARIDGGSDLERTPGGRHGSETAEEGSEGDTGRLTVADLAAKVGATPSSGRRHRRRADPDEQTDGQVDEQSDVEPDGEPGDASGADNTGAGGAVAGRERPGVDPDVEQTARLQLPPDIRD
ncbi:hypothetical protein [Dietzia sp. ANT_WB102]|uniref:hypothetical protein n=1 Tax=Dietzia sp. ANT_WB102 TaxID=2597345 RepID=UPI0011EFB96A|nr:hypothetical protein [Dietzia sp. ANT_WB102]KAA0918729.1 hypothetical protein FQ137_05240 [Dietzia sp. ANT_WB102]